MKKAVRLVVLVWLAVVGNWYAASVSPALPFFFCILVGAYVGWTLQKMFEFRNELLGLLYFGVLMLSMLTSGMSAGQQTFYAGMAVAMGTFGGLTGGLMIWAFHSSHQERKARGN